MYFASAVIVLLSFLSSTVSGGYIHHPVALSAHPIPVATVVHTPVIVKAPIASSYQSFTKVDRPALVAYTPIVKPIVPTYTVVKPALHYAAPLPLPYHGYGYHGYHGYHGYLH